MTSSAASRPLSRPTARHSALVAPAPGRDGAYLGRRAAPVSAMPGDAAAYPGWLDRLTDRAGLVLLGLAALLLLASGLALEPRPGALARPDVVTLDGRPAFEGMPLLVQLRR